MCSACTASAEFSLLRSAKAQIIHQLHLPMEGWAWGLLIQALTCQALLSFALSLRLYWGERTLEFAKGCLKLCVVFHKQLNDEPSNPIEKTFPQMQWGVAGRVWNFQGLKRHLYSSCVKKVCWVRTNRALYFGALLSRRYLAVFHFSQHTLGCDH